MIGEKGMMNWYNNRWPVIVALLLIAGILFFSMVYDQKTIKTPPRVSLITSVWNGDEFIEGFLADITQQTIFSECELILINPNSPGNEEPIIRKYMKLYPNIIYERLPKDPGLFAVWNYAIKKASSEYISNANIDDRSRFDALEMQVKLLEENPNIDLAYTDYLITEHPNETFENNHYRWIVPQGEFCIENMTRCLPGPRPVWRKSMHERFGFFNEKYISAGDMEMWLRAVSLDSQFKRIPVATTLYYMNPKGLSTDENAEKTKLRDAEQHNLFAKYSYLWK